MTSLRVCWCGHSTRFWRRIFFWLDEKKYVPLAELVHTRIFERPLPAQGQAQARPVCSTGLKKTKKLRRSDLSRRFGFGVSKQVAPTELAQKKGGLLQTGRPYGAGEADLWVMTSSANGMCFSDAWLDVKKAWYKTLLDAE